MTTQPRASGRTRGAHPVVTAGLVVAMLVSSSAGCSDPESTPAGGARTGPSDACSAFEVFSAAYRAPAPPEARADPEAFAAFADDQLAVMLGALEVLGVADDGELADDASIVATASEQFYGNAIAYVGGDGEASPTWSSEARASVANIERWAADTCSPS